VKEYQNTLNIRVLFTFYTYYVVGLSKALAISSTRVVLGATVTAGDRL